jgi:hypothetical protein
VLSGVAASLSSLSSAQVATLPPCLHGQSEEPAQRIRREGALKTAAQINAAEHGNIPLNRILYRPFDRLGIPAPPVGFRLQLVLDGTTYAFSLKDTLDPCQYAIWSDQDEWVFATTPEPRIQVLRAQAR